MRIIIFLFLFAFLFVNANVYAQCFTFSVSNSADCQKDSTAFADVSVSSGGPLPYTYDWGIGNATTNSASHHISGLYAGNYTLTITDAVGCDTTFSFVVNAPQQVWSATILSQIDANCGGAATGSLVAGTTPSVAPVSYIWHHGQSAQTATGLYPGGYTVTVTDSIGCQSAANGVIIGPPALVVSTTVVSNYNGHQLSCNLSSDGCAQANIMGGSPGYTYEWSTGETTAMACNLSAGMHMVTITDAQGCQVQDTVNVIPPPPITVSISQSGNVLTPHPLGGAGSAYAYVWTTGETTRSININLAGTYCVTVSDANGCASSACQIINHYPLITPQHVSCHGLSNGCASAVFNGGTAPYTYLWSTGETVNNICNLTAGVHDVTITDNTGATAIGSTTITEPNPISTTVTETASILCFGGTGELTANPTGGTSPYVYDWGAGATLANSISGLASGTYCVVITDNNGCKDTACQVLIEPSALVVWLSGTAVSCNGGNDGTSQIMAAGGTGALSYVWPYGGQTSQIATGLSSGVYCPTIADANGCTITDCVTITEPSAVTTTIGNLSNYSGANVSCHGSDGVAEVITVGGIAPYSFLWDYNSQSTHTATGLTSGNNCVTITDANGCTVSDCINLTQMQPLAISFVGTDTVCAGGGTTNIAAQPSGLGPWTFNWDYSNTSDNITAGVGTHRITVTDNYGCVGIDSITIDSLVLDVSIAVPAPPLGNAQHLFSGENMQLPAVTNHASHYTWLPNNGTISCTSCDVPIVAPSNNTTYYVTATDPSLGCTAEDSVLIEVYNNSSTDSIYLEMAADSSIDYCIILPPFISGNAGTSNSTLFSGLYGSLVNNANYGCLSYQNSGTIPQVVDTVVWVNCEQLCDTTVVFITTAGCVWPGDTDSDGIANNMDLLPIGLHHGATGTARAHASTNYTCQPALDWMIGTTGNPSVDIKHSDCDGNGTINSLDTNAIILNWAQMHQRRRSSSSAGIDIYIDTATAAPGDTVTLDIVLGNGIPNNGYGVAFTIGYDPAGVDSSSLELDFSNSWLGTVGNDMIGIYKDFYHNGIAEVALTRIDQNSVAGSGVIGQVRCIIKDDVLPRSNSLRLDFNIYNVRFIDNSGTIIPTNPLPSQVLVTNTTVNQMIIEKAKNTISLFPNPTKERIQIRSTADEIQSINVYDLQGRLVLQEQGINKLEKEINLAHLESGLYILQLQSDSELKTFRIIKQ